MQIHEESSKNLQFSFEKSSFSYSFAVNCYRFRLGGSQNMQSWSNKKAITQHQKDKIQKEYTLLASENNIFLECITNKGVYHTTNF